MASKVRQMARQPRHALRHPQRAARRRTRATACLDALLTVIPSLPRPALARIVQKAINRMDDLDGDPDREDDDSDRCLAGDDCCGPIIIHGHAYWGSHIQTMDRL